MSFLEIVFPEDIAYGAVGGPTYSTSVVSFRQGREKRNLNWNRGVLRWDVAHGVKDSTQMETLEKFFRTVRGRAYGFRFKDWTDYKITNENIGTGNGTQTIFKARKKYSFSGANDEYRRLYKLVQGTVEVYKNSVLVTSGITIDHNNGKVTFSTAPANGDVITMTAEFHVPARFDTDEMRKTLEDYNLLTWGNIPVVELILGDSTEDDAS